MTHPTIAEQIAALEYVTNLEESQWKDWVLEWNRPIPPEAIARLTAARAGIETLRRVERMERVVEAAQKLHDRTVYVGMNLCSVKFDVVDELGNTLAALDALRFHDGIVPEPRQ